MVIENIRHTQYMAFIRSRDQLTQEQIKWLQRPSVGFFGPGYQLARGLWLILIISFVLRSEVNTMLNDILTTSGVMLNAAIWVLTVSGALYIVTLWWGVKNARRWSWNTNRWANFETFTVSENIWHKWGIIGIVLAIIIAMVMPFIHIPTL